jgi:Fe-S cluster assembly protein SufD
VIGLASGLSAGGAADGVALERNVERLGALAVPGDSFELLHFALLTDAVSVEVDAGVVLADPVVIVHVIDPVGGTGGKSPVLVPHTVVSLAEGSEASVVELFVTPAGDAVAAGDSGPSALVLPIAELQVADAAHLAYTGMQALPDSFWEIASQVSTIGRDASLRSFSAGLGGGYARLRSDSRLLGQNGHASLCAAYLGTGRQVLDFRTLQSHEAPRTESDLLFKGAVADTARSVYTGMIRILHGAVKSNAFQTNQNLVLSEGAHADSVPNLDIHENDVKCSHASTVGPIDEDQRYYLESRGVEPTEAERLIVFGFFSDLASRAPVAGITRWIERLVSAKLSTGSRLGSTIGEPNG